MEPGNEQDGNGEWSGFAWEDLLYDIQEKKCIPFIGPGASAKWTQLDDIARDWAEKIQFPYSLEHFSQLPLVAQFLAIREGDEVPKKRLSRHLKNRPIPDFSAPEHENSVYAVLADLHLPIYITTNYDHLMEEALTGKGKEPISEHSIWNEAEGKQLRVRKTNNEEDIIDTGYSNRMNNLPKSARPLVFHLLGDMEEPASIVLTEKDYIDFAIYLSKMGDKYTLPTSIRQSLSGSTLLFIGYRLEDLSFLIVFEGFIKLMSSLRNTNIAVQVQIPPRIDPIKEKDIQNYLSRFTENYFKIRIHWDNPETFLQELRKRWLMMPKLSNK